jgi:hypothetical protein
LGHCVARLSCIAEGAADIPRVQSPSGDHVVNRSISNDRSGCGGPVPLQRSVELDVMRGADGGASAGARPGQRWDVALSFAGAQRDYAGEVTQALKARGCAASMTLMNRIGWGDASGRETAPGSTRGSGGSDGVGALGLCRAGSDLAGTPRWVQPSGGTGRGDVLDAWFDDSKLLGLLDTTQLAQRWAVAACI